MDFRFKDEVGDELRWISLVSSGDPVIHMWITFPLGRGKGGPHTSACLSSLIPSTMLYVHLFRVLS